MGRIARSGSEADQHAHTVPFGVGCEQFALDARRNLLPFGFRPLARRDDRRLTGFGGKATCKALLDRGRGSQDVGRPGAEALDNDSQAVAFAPAINTARDVRLDGGPFPVRQRTDRVSAAQIRPVAPLRSSFSRHRSVAPSARSTEADWLRRRRDDVGSIPTATPKKGVWIARRRISGKFRRRLRRASEECLWCWSPAHKYNRSR